MKGQHPNYFEDHQSREKKDHDVIAAGNYPRVYQDYTEYEFVKCCFVA